MIAKKRRFSPGVVLCAGLTLTLASLAQAQPIFQSTFPGGGLNDAARGGVLLTKDGGTISVGETQTFDPNGQYDVYVVKTNECGFLQWSTSYDFGGSDYGRKIRATEDGGYIIVGTTDRATCCDEKNLAADIFLLKIDANGGVQWGKTYGGASYDEGTDVQIHPFDGGYTVTGNTQSFGDGKINGYLQRTDANGNIIWGRSYGQRDGAEFFNSCTVTAKGDILVTGSTYSFGGQHILAIRTDADGFINPTGWATFYPSKGAGNGRHIIETSDGTFVIAGGLVTTETGTLDGYLLRIDGAGTALFDQAFAEAYGKYGDELAEVREIFDGHLIFTGYLTDAPGGFGGRDLLLGEVDYKFNPQWYSLHGEKLDDEGYSLAFSFELSKERGEVFVAANGVTQNFTRGGEDLYLIQALRGGKTGCFDTYPKVKDFRPELQGKQVEYCHPLVRVQCFAKVGVEYHKDQNLLCTSCKFDGLQRENNSDPDLGRLDHDIQQNGLRNEATRVETIQVKGRTEMVRGTR